MTTNEFVALPRVRRILAATKIARGVLTERRDHPAWAALDAADEYAKNSTHITYLAAAVAATEAQAAKAVNPELVTWAIAAAWRVSDTTASAREWLHEGRRF